MTPGPHSRKCTPYLLGGPGGMPLALRLSEGLDRSSGRWPCASEFAAPRTEGAVCAALQPPSHRRWRTKESCLGLAFRDLWVGSTPYGRRVPETDASQQERNGT